MSLASSITSFAVVAGLITILPGPDTAMVIRSAARDGRTLGFATALGINTGVIIWGAATAVGITALIEISTVAYTVLRIAGACYMLWLGSRLLLQALRSGKGSAGEVAVPDGGSRRPLRSWGRGLTTNLLNPKFGAFYVSVIPQFIPAHASHLMVGLLLAGINDLENLIWFSVIILAAHSVRGLLASRRTERVLDGITGTVLIGFGLRIGLSPR